MTGQVSAVIVALLVALEGWQGLWQQVRDRIAARHDSEAGATAVLLEDFEVTGRDGGRGWYWRLAEAQAEETGAGEGLEIRFEGRQQLVTGGSEAARHYAIEAEALAARLLAEEGGHLERSFLTAEGLRVERGAAVWQADTTEITLTNGAAGLGFDVALYGLEREPLFGPCARSGFVLDRVSLDGRLEGDGQAPFSVAAWRRAGGALAIPALRLEWNDLVVTATADLRTDSLMRPEGRIRLHILDPAALADALDAAGFGCEEGGRTLKAALATIAGLRGSDGGGLALPFLLAGGRMTLYGLTVAELSPITEG